MRGRDKNLGMGNEPARTLHAVLQRRCFYGLTSFKLDCNDLGWWRFSRLDADDEVEVDIDAGLVNDVVSRAGHDE